MGWKPEYAANRRAKYQSDAAERERRKSQGRSPERNREYMREYYRVNKERFQQYQQETRDRRNANRRRRYAEDPEYRAECIRLSKLRDKESIRDYRLRKQFGITADEYDELLELQGGGCAICYADIGDASGKRLSVDHCHETGAVRGILCGSCNLGLGKFQDDAAILARAVDYLVRTERRTGLPAPLLR